MPRLMRDFVCQNCGEHIERFIDTSKECIECGCGGSAFRTVGMPRVALDGTDDGFPGAYDRWARIREDNARIKARRNAE